MMKLEDAYPIIVIDKLAECRDFYSPVEIAVCMGLGLR
jgi:hypothetical protein